MIEPKAVSEQLLFSTIRLETNRGSGTGFFFHFKTDDNAFIPGIITNKHVIGDTKQQMVKFFLHIGQAGNPKPTDENMTIPWLTSWISHPNIDLCFAFTNPLIMEIKARTQKDVFYIPLTEELIWEDSKLEELQAVEDILMVGYPIGLFDQKNNFPLLRKGVTATHPAVNFNGESEGIIDCACFPGSSGSPILLWNIGGYTDKNGSTHLGAQRVALLGVLSRGPMLDAQGNIIVKDVPTQQTIATSTPIMVNLGYYIKAKEILKIKEGVLKIVNKK